MSARVCSKVALKTPLPFILLPFVFFVVAPAFLLKQNPQDLGDLDPRAFLLLLLAAGGGRSASTRCARCCLLSLCACRVGAR